ncbi:hypothetical protein SNE40_001051 [Patella caerulea]|uniref:NADH dehydrogenase [ubiquinone] 1 alpha subcomplex subunit 1 n=1 Tax=Patella caerulea TaxID=87958 RepID=A0AAN8KBR5_PATCE
MWYEILPCVGIMVGAMTLPNMFSYVAQKVFRNGKHCCRDWEAGLGEDQKGYKRDRYITGSEYIPRGLESIPDLKS